MTDEEKTNEQKQPKKRGKRRTRKHGSGSLFRRPERKGKQWVAQIVLENGKTKQRYFNTEKEADEALNDMLYEQRRGTLITEKDQLSSNLWNTGLSKSTDPPFVPAATLNTAVP